MTGSQTSRRVYFPRGNWFDFFTGEKIVGGTWRDVRKSLDQVPLYVKGNTLLPLAEPVEHVTRDTVFDVTVKIYGPQPPPMTLFEDDGLTLDFQKGKQSQLRLSWSSAPSTVRTGPFSPRRYHVVGWVKAY
jgi:alpha-D-xyloside xylohydrolase